MNEENFHKYLKELNCGSDDDDSCFESGKHDIAYICTLDSLL